MAAFAPSHILIIGATGNIGKYITNSIVQAKPAFPKVTILTSESTLLAKAALLNDWKEAGVSVIIGNVEDPKDVADAYVGVDTVISCVGRAVLEQQKQLIQLAEESKSVQWFFPSEYGTDIEHNPQSITERPHQMKLAIRKFVREHTKRLKVTYIVVGPYFDMWVDGGKLTEQLGGFDLENKTATLLADGGAQIGFTTMVDTGKAVLAALRHPPTSFNKALKVASFVVTPNQILAEFEKQLGIKFNVKHVSLSDLEASEARLWKEGDPFATVATLRRIWATGGTLYDNWDNASIELNRDNMDSLEAAVRRCIHEELT